MRNKVSRFFYEDELWSPDNERNWFDHNFLVKLDKVRETAAIPFVVTSACRTPEHNARVGGRHNSSHLKGLAMDIAATGSLQRFLIVAAALKWDVARIGIGKTFVHLDDDPDKPRPRMWHYY